MAEKRILDIEKQAELFSGRERAGLLIKDIHQRNYGDKKGFLNEREKQSLMRMPDSQIKEYEALWGIYEGMPSTMAAVTEVYQQFKYHFEALKKAHLLLNLSPAVSYLSQLIEQNIANEDAKTNAHKVVDLIQVMKIDRLGNPAFKESLRFIKGIVTKASEQARQFISMKNEVDRINEVIGFNVFITDHYGESCRIFAEEISLCIKEHNRIMSSIGEGVPDLSDYLISEPEYI